MAILGFIVCCLLLLWVTIGLLFVAYSVSVGFIETWGIGESIGFISAMFTVGWCWYKLFQNAPFIVTVGGGG